MTAFERKASIKQLAPKKKCSTIPTSNRLSQDEPIGTYRIDKVGEELFAAGGQSKSTIELARKLRNKINLAAEHATAAAKN